jgi:hypothetical protein
MTSVGWYWHRLKAMSAAELAGHGRRKLHQLSDHWDSGRRFATVSELPAGAAFPQLPPAASAPEELRAALQRDAVEILKGRWIAFGHLPLQVENPPRWHKDYLAGVDLATRKPALKLHHRLEGKADIKVIWELSRWFSIVRLAQAAYVLGDSAAAGQCLDWLENWVQENPPYYGWNWTSALESGLRLVQFAWIDALLSAMSGDGAAPTTRKLGSLRAAVLLPHVWFTWRDRSFGSSANNHLIGELAGLIVAGVRWPTLANWAAPLERLQQLWESQVLTQFAPDGGNREQALNYHLFSWEFCWQARLALQAAGRTISPGVENRLQAAAGFYLAVQAPEQQWDYGDSDSAFVTPFFDHWSAASTEWYHWLQESSDSPSITYWLGAAPPAKSMQIFTPDPAPWQWFAESGFAVCRAGDWFLRWDLSALGYLATAGHGHCDALHLSVWYRGEAVLIDPGTGAYHADRRLRDYLASWEAHNGPHPIGPAFPERRGAFLWSAHHALPRLQKRSDLSVNGELKLPAGTMRRSVTYLPAENGWQIEDGFDAADSSRPQALAVLWQMSPQVKLRPVTPGYFELQARAAAISMRIEGWQEVKAKPDLASAGESEVTPQKGVCSPAFRRIERGPFIQLRGTTGASAALRTLLGPADNRSATPRKN